MLKSYNLVTLTNLGEDKRYEVVRKRVCESDHDIPEILREKMYPQQVVYVVRNNWLRFNKDSRTIWDVLSEKDLVRTLSGTNYSG
jgi:hypothetical protein